MLPQSKAITLYPTMYPQATMVSMLWRYGRKEKKKKKKKEKNQLQAVRCEVEPIDPTLLKGPLNVGWGELPIVWQVRWTIWYIHWHVEMLLCACFLLKVDILQFLQAVIYSFNWKRCSIIQILWNWTWSRSWLNQLVKPMTIWNFQSLLYPELYT